MRTQSEFAGVARCLERRPVSREGGQRHHTVHHRTRSRASRVLMRSPAAPSARPSRRCRCSGQRKSWRSRLPSACATTLQVRGRRVLRAAGQAGAAPHVEPACPPARHSLRSSSSETIARIPHSLHGCRYIRLLCRRAAHRPARPARVAVCHGAQGGAAVLPAGSGAAALRG